MSEIWDIIRDHQKTWPVHVVPIANDLGIEVYRVSNWPENISGRIYVVSHRGDRPRYAIDVNGNHSETRRRFTISHELAHYILHKDKIGEGIYDDGLYRSGLSSTVESQANKVAAEILMPSHLMTKAINQGITSVSELARAFNVSEASMSLRLGSIA